MNDSLINAMAQTWAYQLRRPVIIQTGTQALNRLIMIALGRTAAANTVGHFLLGLYDGATFRFELEHMRRLGEREFEDCLRVLEMDHVPEVEVHERVDKGDHVWRELMEVWRTQPLEFVSHPPARDRSTEPRGKERGAIKARGIAAFDRLLQTAEGCTSHSRIVALFLMSLIHNGRYRFNLTDLRGLDIKLFEDCISVMRMDYFTDIEASHS